MDINTDPGALFNAGSGVLIIALGAFVFAARPKKDANRAFLVWSLGFGGQAIAFNLFVGRAYFSGPWFWATFGLGLMVLGVGAIMLARSSMIRPARGSRLGSVAAYGLPAIFGLPIILTELVNVGWIGQPFFVQPHQYPSWIFVSFAGVLGIGGGTVLASQAARRAWEEPEQAGPLAAIAVASLLQGANFAAVWIGLGPQGAIGLCYMAMVAIGAGWWLARVRGLNARYARNVALIPLGLAATGAVVGFGAPDFQLLVDLGFFGFARLLAGGIIAFAIVRHQILGFDVKVRRGIKGSTLAALFFAVFFVVSETTAEVLGGTEAGPFVGIAVAGGLVFFLAPLQRWADRLAGAATGDAKPVEQQSDDERLATYRATAVAAWADGSVDAKERALLDTLRETLGLSFEQAGRIESEASA